MSRRYLENDLSGADPPLGDQSAGAAQRHRRTASSASANRNVLPAHSREPDMGFFPFGMSAADIDEIDPRHDGVDEAEDINADGGEQVGGNGDEFEYGDLAMNDLSRTRRESNTIRVSMGSSGIDSTLSTAHDNSDGYVYGNIDSSDGRGFMPLDGMTSRTHTAAQIGSRWKRELYLLLEDPSSSHAAFLVNIFVSFMIIFSAVISTIETIPALHGDHPQLWFNFETSIVIIFTIEYLLRLVAHSNSWRSLWNHLRSVLSIVDFISIFPFYIELMMHRDTSFEFRFTILRIFRLLRVFSVFKYSSLVQLSIEVVIVAIKRSADALGALFFFMILILVIFSSLLYFVERGVWNEGERKFLTSKGEVSDFDSIPAAFWFVMVTLTTTGYGDMVPQTFIGKLISFPLMLCGILIIALPSIIVGRNFTIVWEAMKRRRRLQPTQRRQPRANRLHSTGTLDEVGSSIDHHHYQHSNNDNNDNRLSPPLTPLTPPNLRNRGTRNMDEDTTTTAAAIRTLETDIQNLYQLCRDNQAILSSILEHMQTQQQQQQHQQQQQQ